MKIISVGSNFFANMPTANIDAKYGVYESREKAYKALGKEGADVIALGLTVGIKTDKGIEEYWWKNGFGLEDLVPKGISSAKFLEEIPDWAKRENKPSYTADEVGALPNTTTHLSGDIPTLEKGAKGGVATLDENGKVPSCQLPSYIDDVLEFANDTYFPKVGEKGKVYMDMTTNKTYRWGGSVYVPIGADLALGETISTAYAGNKGKKLEERIVVMEEEIKRLNVIMSKFVQME